MKWIKKNIFKIFIVVFVVFLVFYVPIFVLKKARDNEIYKQPNIDTKIYQVWHIETFEGGGKSRISYLKTIAREMEKANKGVLFMIKQIDPDKLTDELNNSTPDIISFGFGLGQTILPILQNFDTTFNVQDKLVESGSFNQKLYAVPYMLSGYALITHGVDTQNLHAGTTGYTSFEPIVKSLNKTVKETETQYEAYKDFVYNKDVVLLGSARDVFRVNNLNKVGRANACITPIDSYTDLIQYVGVTKFDNIINNFVSLMLDDTHQTSLRDYSLFTVKNNKIYACGIYNDMENALSKAVVPNVFS